MDGAVEQEGAAAVDEPDQTGGGHCPAPGHALLENKTDDQRRDGGADGVDAVQHVEGAGAAGPVGVGDHGVDAGAEGGLDDADQSKAGEEQQPRMGRGYQRHGDRQRQRRYPDQLAVAETIGADAGHEVAEDAADGPRGEDQADGGQSKPCGHILRSDKRHH